MTITHFKVVSSMIALVSAVRKGRLEQHLQVEREVLKLCFAFDHINYPRYLSFQQAYLRDHAATNDLDSRGIGGS